ncbi:hypothetical protein Tco_1164840 [Tanacetum coccineum]
MICPNKPTSKPSRVAKMNVKPIWRKKLNPCNTSNGINVNLPTLMPKLLTPHHEPSQENNHPNQALPNPYIKDTPTSPQVVSHPPSPISPINSHVTHTQALPQSDNQTQYTPPLSPSKESLVDEINQLQDLSNLLAMHLSQQQNNISSSPYSPNLSHTLNINQVETHVSFMAKIQEVPTADSRIDTEPLEQDDSNVTPDSPDMCDNDIQTDQNAKDERAALANLIANLKLDVDENKKIQKQLKKANASLAHELKECKSILAETSKTLGESNSIRDSCLIALQNKQTEFERYKALNDRTVDYDKLERKLNETLGLLAQKEIDIKEGLKVKAYEISVVKEKHDELVKQSLLTKSHFEGIVKEKTKVITDLKLKEEKDIDKMISMEKQLKFLNEIVYKRNQSIQTIHMLAPKGPTFNGRPTFANPMYLKKAQYEKPCLYEILYDQSDPANRLVPDREEILTLEKEI